MKYFAALSTLLLLLAGSPLDVSACSCMAPPAPLIALEQSDYVFSGVVKDITPVNAEFGGNLLIRMQVLSRWKGEIRKDVIIETADNSAACGYYFEKGKSYLVYGAIHDNVLQTNICTRTTLLENASEDLRDLDEGEEISSYRPRCGGPASAVVIQTFMFLFIGIVFLKKKPPFDDIA